MLSLRVFVASQSLSSGSVYRLKWFQVCNSQGLSQHCLPFIFYFFA